MALSLYRKYRPNTFADVVGQEHVENTLVNAVAEGTVAHAYLFCGPRGTGKTTSARLLAKALLCEKAPTAQPDGTCPQCEEIAAGTHPDVYELDAASRTGVENVREEIISRVQFAPTRGSRKIYIIDEVHMLSPAAFNALLKTLEEPPSHVVFIMCTTDPHKVPETVQSRCQRFDFRRFSIEQIVSYLTRICQAEGFTFEQEALELIAAKANGGMRDATTALEQVAVSTSGAITLNAARGQLGQLDVNGLFEIAGFIAARDAAQAFGWVARMVEGGIDLNQCARDLAGHVRNLYVTSLTGGDNGLVACPASDLSRYVQQAATFGGPDRLSRALTVCGDLCSELRNSADVRLSFEIALTRLCRAESDLTLEGLAERVESLEQGVPAPKVVACTLAPAEFAAAAQPAPASEPAAQPEPEPTFAPEPEPVFEPEPEPVQHILGAASMDEPAYYEPEPVYGEPEPVAQPEPVPVASQATDMSTARVLAAVLAHVKANDVPTGALLNGVDLERDASGYHLIFPEGGDFAMRLVCHGEAHALITEAFEQALGAPTQFDCRACSKKGSQRKPSFESVSMVEAAAPSSYVDEGYDEAQAAYADMAAYADQYADEAYGAFDEPAPAAVSYEPAAEHPLEQPDAQGGKDDIADALSVFGGAVRFEEI